MLLNKIKKKAGSLEMLQSLMNDNSRKVHGAFYDNNFFSQRYLTRSHILDKKVDIEEDTVRLTLGTRVEVVGLMELENTLDMLVEHSAGDIPSFALHGEQTDLPVVPEVVSPNQYLYTVDLVLVFKQPTVSYQEFKIAGTTFTLVTLEKALGEEDEFEQEVQLLFGDADKLYLFSHFYDKELTPSEVELVMDFIIDKNITGKAIVGVKLETASGASSGLFPYDKLISSYRGGNGDYILGATTGYIRIPEKRLKRYKLRLEPNAKSGSYRLDLVSKQETIKIHME